MHDQQIVATENTLKPMRRDVVDLIKTINDIITQGLFYPCGSATVDVLQVCAIRHVKRGLLDDTIIVGDTKCHFRTLAAHA